MRQEVAAHGLELVVFPELAICGYPPKDLLLQHGFVESCEAAVESLAHNLRGVRGSDGKGVCVVVGTPRRVPGGTANSLAVIQTDGGGVSFYDKRLLPTYDVFDEDRYFVPGEVAGVVEVGGKRVGLAICEDLWRGEDAGFASRYSVAGAADPILDVQSGLAAMGVNMVVSPSASPFVVGKGGIHSAIVARHAQRLGVPVMSVNQSGGNDELVFDGHAFCYNGSGQLVAGGALFGETTTVVTLGASPLPGNISVREGGEDGDVQDLFDALVTGIRDYLRKCGFHRAILGLSGGIDSALTASLAVAAVGAKNVRGLAMPSKYSSDHSVADALELAQRLGMACDVTSIQEAVDAAGRLADGVFASMGERGLGVVLPDLAEENVQSRVRGLLLMAASNRTGSIVLTTGNKSELAVGYCTLYGDMNGGLAVLSDVSKQWVYRLSRFINARHQRLGFSQPPIPQRTIDKAPSAELRPDQKDQDSLPPYAQLDALIEGYVERRESLEEVLAAAAKAGGPSPEEVRRVVRLIDLAEYKRKQAATGLKVTSIAFGSGRRWPIAWQRD